MLVAVLAAFVGGFYLQRRELSLLLQANQQQLKAKDVTIEAQQAQLTKLQQQVNESASQVGAIQTKLDESQKALAASQQRLTIASREVANANAARSVAARRPASRAPTSISTPPPAQPVSARRTAQPGVYETTQATAVHENPSDSGRVISQIGRGTRINVVSSSGDWLEVRSNRGNPPGYVRADAARQIVRAN
jgi:peptidoglycan hydrolase CwlO-like protein